jgi:nitric oxide reductase large subunit
MVTLKDFAKVFEPQQMKNIADLESVSVDVEIKTETRKNKETNEEYIVSFILVNKDEYRVVSSVIEQLKGILEANPNLKTFKVKKTGSGMGTKYQVITLS